MIVLFFAIYSALGEMKPSTEPVIGEVIAGFSAEKAGLKANDRILSVDGQEVTTWNEFTEKIKSVTEGQDVLLQYRRGEEIGEVTVTPQLDKRANRVLIGVQSSVVYSEMALPEAFALAVNHTRDITVAMIDAIAGLFKNPEQTDQLAGPIGIVQMSGQVAERGFIPLLNFAALLSINLGIINLLPVPVLDGGHFVNLFIEAVRGKPLGSKAVAYTQRVGIALLLMLMIFATKNDIVRVFLK